MATGQLSLPIPGQFDGTNPPGLTFISNVPTVLFDDTTQETMYWQFRMPSNYASGPVLKVQYSMDADATGTVYYEGAIWATTPGDSASVETPSYDTVNGGNDTIPTSIDYMKEISLTMTNADSLAAGDLVRLSFARDADNGSDDATGDMKVWSVSLEYTTT